MSEQKHIIKRQVIELQMQGVEEATQLQARVSRIYREQIVPLIDRYCGQLSGPDKLHRFDSLVVDVGPIRVNELETELAARVGAELRRILAEKIAEQEQNPNQDLKETSRLELFVFFARTGSLPWWGDISQPQALADNLQELLLNSPARLRKTLQQFLPEQKPRLRLVNTYNNELLGGLAALLLPLFKEDLNHDLKALFVSLQRIKLLTGLPANRIRQSLWNNILYLCSLDGPNYPTREDFYRGVLGRVAVDLGINYFSLVRDLNQDLISSKEYIAYPLQGIIEKLYRKFSDFPNPPDSVAQEQEFLNPNQPISSVLGAASAIDSGFSEADELYIGNAGLVILWPFLSHFFARFDLLDDQQFKDSASQQRAVGLLQLIATGEPAFPEYLLPLNKIICGMELTDIFDFGLPVREFEAEECLDLLGAVIQQAPILNEMSVAGFRNSFLLREGILSSRDGAWLLQVERETYDIVLERFPWSWEWLKLPWMEAPVRVEWL
jgi:hypothetical protein